MKHSYLPLLLVPLLTSPLLTSPLWAADQTGGVLVDPDGIEAWSGELTLASNITIGAGDVVTIAPGTIIRAELNVASRYQLAVSGGQLIALGTEEAPIVFTSAEASPAPADWQGLYIYDSAGPNPAINFDHVLIEYTQLALVLLEADPQTVSNLHIANSLNDSFGLPGAGIYASGAGHLFNNLYIENARYTRASTSVYGAGLYAAGVPVEVHGGLFENNTVDAAAPAYGAAIALSNSNALIEDVRFVHNRVLGGQDPSLSFGGAIGVDGSTTAIIRRCEFLNNEVTLTSGFAGGAAIGLAAFATVARIDANYIHDNHTYGPHGCEAGGIVFPFANTGDITNNLIVRNTIGRNTDRACGAVTPIGAGVKMDAASPTTGYAVRLINNTIADNQILTTDDGLSLAQGQGAGVFIRRGKFAVVNNIVVGNQTHQIDGGGGIYLDPNVGTTDTLLDHNLLFDNAPDSVRNASTTFVVGSNNLLANDPGFIGGTNGDLVAYRVDDQSAAYDSGDDALAPVADFLGHVRPIGDHVERGAFEVLNGDLTLAVVAQPTGPIGPSGTAHCLFTLTNAGSSSLPEVAFELTATPAPQTLTASAPSIGADACIVNGSNNGCVAATLASGASLTLDATFDAADATTEISCAGLAVNRQHELTPTNNAAAVTIAVQAPASSSGGTTGGSTNGSTGGTSSGTSSGDTAGSSGGTTGADTGASTGAGSTGTSGAGTNGGDGGTATGNAGGTTGTSKKSGCGQVAPSELGWLALLLMLRAAKKRAPKR